MPNSPLLAPLDQQQVWRQYARASKHGVDDPLAREVDLRMQERLDYIQICPRSILDLGAGVGGSGGGLASRYPTAQLLQLDAAPSLLPLPPRPLSWKQRWLKPFSSSPVSHSPPLSIGGDARKLPLPSLSQGLVWSNMLLPWVDNISAVFSESHRVLETNGLFMFSTLGPDTLQTLNSFFADSAPHCHIFPDMHDLGDLLSEIGFMDPVVDMEMIHVEYCTLPSLLKDLRKAAANNAHQLRKKGLMGKSAWGKFEQHWGNTANQSDTQRVTIRFEIIYGHAWKGAPKTLPDGRSIVHFDPKARNSH